MNHPMRIVLAGPRLALCVVGLLSAATACNGTIDAQETKPSVSSGNGNGNGSSGSSSTNPLTPQPGINESSPNVSGRASGSGSDGEQTADDLGRAASPRGSAGGSRRSRARDERRDAGDEDALADAGIEVDGGVEQDAGAIAIDAGADAAP